jgi:hypothetical protein
VRAVICWRASEAYAGLPCGDLLLKCREPLAKSIDAGVLLLERLNLALLRRNLLIPPKKVAITHPAEINPTNYILHIVTLFWLFYSVAC